MVKPQSPSAQPSAGEVDGVARDDVDRQIVAGDQAFRRRRREGGLLRPIRTVDFRAVLAGFVLCLRRIRRDGHGADDAGHRIDVGELAGAWNQGMKGTGADVDQPQRRRGSRSSFRPSARPSRHTGDARSGCCATVTSSSPTPAAP